ncbi:MAG: hypothetical protein ABSA05_10595 [Opitutaceae bacterium]|jgi:hypothetical protein
MKRILALFFFCARLAPLFAASSSGDAIRIDTEIYVLNKAGLKTSSAEPVVKIMANALGVTGSQWPLFEAPLSMQIGQESVELQDSRFVRTGTAAPPSRLSLASANVIIVRAGQTAEVLMNSPAEYFEKMQDGLFRLHRSPEGSPDGPHYDMKLSARPNSEHAADYEIDCTVDAVVVGGREKIPGVDLDVGKPELKAFNGKLSFQAGAGKWLCLFDSVPNDSDYQLIIVLRARPKQSGK